MLHLLVFDVVGVSEVAEETFYLVLEDYRTFFDYVLDVFEDYVLDLDGGEGDY